MSHFIVNPGTWRILCLPGRKRNVAIDFTRTGAEGKEEALGEAGHCLASLGCNYWLWLRGQAGGAVPPRVGGVTLQPTAELLRCPQAAARRGTGRGAPGLSLWKDIKHTAENLFIRVKSKVEVLMRERPVLHVRGAHRSPRWGDQNFGGFLGSGCELLEQKKN